jgi:putative transposase
MLIGIKLQANPAKEQKKTISQWMGCARFIWNAKCEEEKYLLTFSKKYLPVGTYPKIDQTYSQYKNQEHSPWLFDCPSQILRNSAHNWHTTYRNYLKGQCGKPKRKKKSDVGSIHLTRELFRFEKCPDGVTRLFIGTKTNNIGFLSIKNHRSYEEPNSIRIKKKNGRYWVSFCYENVNEDLSTNEEHLEHLKNLDRSQLEQITVGVDRGIKRPVQAGDEVYDFSPEQKRKKKAKERYIKRCQRRLSRKQKGSKRRNHQKRKLSKAYEKIANIRQDFCHKTSRSIINKEENKVIVLEDLRTRQMTRRPKAKKDESTGKWMPNNKKNKARLNRSILDKGWWQIELFIKYKALRAGKALLKVPAHHTSQECADCSHTHPNNRKTQEKFICESCGHAEHADKNAAEVIKKRAINLILDSGTELSSRGVLLDSGCGATHKTRGANANRARGEEASKKKELAATTA